MLNIIPSDSQNRSARSSFCYFEFAANHRKESALSTKLFSQSSDLVDSKNGARIITSFESATFTESSRRTAVFPNGTPTFDTRFFPNRMLVVRAAHALTALRFSAKPAARRSFMKRAMMFAIGKFKVGYSVVRSFAVTVMNKFRRFEFSPEMARHYQSVFQNVAFAVGLPVTSGQYENISVSIKEPTTFPRGVKLWVFSNPLFITTPAAGVFFGAITCARNATRHAKWHEGTLT